MQRCIVGFPGHRHDAVELSYVCCLFIERESRGISQIIFIYIPCKRKQIVYADTCGYLRKHCHQNVVKRGKIRLLCLFKGKGHDLSLTLGSHIIVIHVSEPCVSHRLDSVQMVHPGMLKLHGSDSGTVYRFRYVSIYIFELSVAYLKIYAPKDIDGVNYGLPVKCGVVVHLYIRVMLQRPDSLFRPASEICLVELMIISVLTYHGVGITVDGNELDLSRRTVDPCDYIDIRERSLTDISVPRIYSKHSHGIISALPREHLEDYKSNKKNEYCEYAYEDRMLFLFLRFLTALFCCGFFHILISLSGISDVFVFPAGFFSFCRLFLPLRFFSRRPRLLSYILPDGPSICLFVIIRASVIIIIILKCILRR